MVKNSEYLLKSVVIIGKGINIIIIIILISAHVGVCIYLLINLEGGIKDGGWVRDE